MLLRATALTVAILLLAELVPARWYWYLALWVFCFASFSITSIPATFVSFWLMTGLFEPSDTWHIVLVVFTLLSVLRAARRRPVLRERKVRWQWDGVRRRGWRE